MSSAATHAPPPPSAGGVTGRLWRNVSSRLPRSSTARFIAKRLGAGILVLWGTTILTYVGIGVLPGNAASQLLGPGARPGQVQALTRQLHLDDPLWVQYWDWLSGVLHGDLGNSLVTRVGVGTVIANGLPVTLELAIVSFVVALGVAVPIAILAARRPNGIIDQVITGLSLAGLSIAPYILALVLVLVFAVELGVFPAIGWVPLSTSITDNIRCIVLPCISLGLPFACIYVRVLRGDLVQQMSSQPYVETAKAKGASQWRVLIKHALRNSTFTLVTVAGVNLGMLFGSTVIVEQIFALPGIGRQLLWSINNQDTPVVAGLVLIFAGAVVVANLLTDVLYSVLDPRIRRGRAGS